MRLTLQFRRGSRLALLLVMGAALSEPPGNRLAAATKDQQPSASAHKPPTHTVSYNHDICPILSQNCFFCHGPDAGKRKAKLRLDVRESALQREAFVPGKPQESELVRRIYATNTDDLMPPPDSNKSLTPTQRTLLRRWIAEGAVYEKHWAYVKPVRPATPPSANPIDWLVDQRLKEIKLSPSPVADRRTLARRLYFDLIGVPPKPEEVAAFIHDKSLDAYPRLVEKLLASPHFGERMALGWLDAVRYADTVGYHSDNPRNVWPYRDYVIKSFNEDKPFDVFTREQIAGDLLPQSGLEQKVGSAFNRLLLTTEEGGAQPKDYEARMLTDRVRAIGTVWLGQTIGCAQCHDHKFDPITQRDFYSLGAFFADIKEPDVGKREDGMFVPNEAQAVELKKHEAEVGRWENEFNGQHPELHDAFAAWDLSESENARQERLWSVLKPLKDKSAAGNKLDIQSDDTVLASGSNASGGDTYVLTLANLPAAFCGIRIESLPDESLSVRGSGGDTNGDLVLRQVIAEVEHTNGSSEKVVFAAVRSSSPSEPALKLDAVIDSNTNELSGGWSASPQLGQREQLFLSCGETINVSSHDTLKLEIRQSFLAGTKSLGHFRISAATNALALSGPFTHPPPKDLADILIVPASKREQAQKDKLWEAFKDWTPELATVRTNLAAARKAQEEFEATVPRCLVSVVNDKPNIVRILLRGNFLIETGDIVQPAFPAFLKASWQRFDKPRLTRLDLANWLVSRDNPLTARVVMNRMWRQFFGAGLARPLDDFGVQGDPPQNQPLLDWLACEFMDSGWDMKQMVRLMVNSRTYKETSVLSQRAREVDPLDREFSAQGRWRLDAELVRDNALAVSGLLVDKIGGSSVKPYQPEGYWDNLNFPPRTWDQGKGDDLYRRGLYTWWQRSYLQPSLLAFDAPTREECCVERNRSNIPQQALVLLNDPTYVEASRVFAEHILEHGGNQFDSRLDWAWQRALDRLPRKDEAATVKDLLDQQLSEYHQNPEAAKELLSVGAAPVPRKDDAVQLAAWSNVARIILNLHETITRN